MMRKLFTCCTAAGLLVGGLYLAARHAATHPDCFLGRCLVAVTGSAALFNPVTGVGALAVEHVLPSCPSEVSGVVAIEGLEDGIPADPTPVEEVPAEPIPPALAGVIEIPAPDPAPPPAPIVIPEEDREPPVLVGGRGDEPPTAEPESDRPAAEMVETVVVMPAAAWPRRMPYCAEDEGEVPDAPMPYALDGDDDSPGVADEVFEFFKGFFTSAIEGDARGCSEARCKQGAHCPRHSTACHNDCPVFSTFRLIVPAAPQKRTAGAEEASEEPPAAPQSYRRIPEPAGRPLHPDVDTMEFRPSDAGLNEYGRGPL